MQTLWGYNWTTTTTAPFCQILLIKLPLSLKTFYLNIGVWTWHPWLFTSFSIFTITAVSFWLEKRPKLQTNSGDVSPLNAAADGLKPTLSEVGRIGALARKSKMWQECFYVFNGPVKLEVNYCCPTRQSFKRPLLKPPRRARTELRSSLFYYYYLWVCFFFFSCSICLFNHPLMFYC